VPWFCFSLQPYIILKKLNIYSTMAQLVKPMFTPFPTHHPLTGTEKRTGAKTVSAKTFHRAHHGTGYSSRGA
jgi:hypothetical protein